MTLTTLSYTDSILKTNRETDMKGLFARYMYPNNGYPHDQTRIQECGLVEGQSYEVTDVVVHAYTSEIFLKGFNRSFNSVNFRMEVDDNEYDITANTTFYSDDLKMQMGLYRD